MTSSAAISFAHHSHAASRFTRLSFARFCRYVPALLSDRADALRQIALDHGDVVELPIPGKRLHLVTHPDHARHVLQKNNKNYRRSFDFRIVRTFLGEGLITSHDALWQHARRTVTPSFGREMVGSLTESIALHVERFERDRLSGSETTLLANRAMSALSLQVFAGTMLGIDVRPREAEILETIAIALRHLDRRLVAMLDVDAYLPTISGARFRGAVRRFDLLIDGWVSERRARPAQTPNLLDVLIDASESIEPKERRPFWLRDQIATYLATGHETIAVALAWSLLMLAEHPDVQARVREEGHLVGGSPASPSYTESVLLETLRLYPPVWSIGREAVREDRLGDALVPAGSTVMVSPYAIHRRPDLWPAPDTFRPERFLRGRPSTPFSYIPFGAGAHRCIGEHLSMLELTTIVAMLVSRFRIQRRGDAPIGKDALISLRPKPDFPITLRRLR